MYQLHITVMNCVNFTKANMKFLFTIDNCRHNEKYLSIYSCIKNNSTHHSGIDQESDESNECSAIDHTNVSELVLSFRCFSNVTNCTNVDFLEAHFIVVDSNTVRINTEL